MKYDGFGTLRVRVKSNPPNDKARWFEFYPPAPISGNQFSGHCHDNTLCIVNILPQSLMAKYCSFLLISSIHYEATSN